MWHLAVTIDRLAIYSSADRLARNGLAGIGILAAALTGAFFGAEVISAQIRTQVGIPDTVVIKRQNACGGGRQDGTLHVTLLSREILRKGGAGILDVMNATGAGEVLRGLKRGFRGHPVIRMISWVDVWIQFGDVQLNRSSGASLVVQDCPER